jgi:hypothetical protein
MKENDISTTASSGTPKPADVESIDAIITTAYRLISGPAGQKRDWDRMRSLFIPGARQIPTNKQAGVRNPEGETPEVLDFDGYVSRVSEYFEQNGFFEVEIARRTEQYDRIAHVFSTYESRHSLDDAKPFMRGINSIQLFNDGTRWWIVTIFWQQESTDHRIPEKYLATA